MRGAIVNIQGLTHEIETLREIVNAAASRARDTRAYVSVTLKDTGNRGSDTIANVTLALRHLEDASSRLSRALEEMPDQYAS